MSERCRAFAMDHSETQATTFDSRALCTELEARLQRLYNHELQDAFIHALDSLPSAFERENEDHKALFGDFLNEHGARCGLCQLRCPRC